ncbi:MAG TPA: bacillithiol system redox-active protein YtxJ [Gemmatimonadaceae bacterium]|nr:bacillithiol system redox-active protein YtxJ [Gemmatimonadaceae bacterium]
MQHIQSPEELEDAIQAPIALLYKHSETCPISAMALREVAHLAEAYPELPVYVVDVHAQRGLARGIAARFDIRHESPQAILLRDGAPVWHASHFRVTARALEAQLGERAERAAMSDER